MTGKTDCPGKCRRESSRNLSHKEPLLRSKHYERLSIVMTRRWVPPPIKVLTSFGRGRAITGLSTRAIVVVVIQVTQMLGQGGDNPVVWSGYEGRCCARLV
ncbi:hypothetical protein AVEN_233092-1 [Araneus ventricosus]|uniref:Uncharacterized protein n=1 Tax=Araneus ventricosus TaxID=182803 RepID=A0A4Y2T7H5_ARAVE|nr:hypothetical protein AVEN_233092-1 [Araneus ventricosus]